MARVAFNRAIADMGRTQKKSRAGTAASSTHEGQQADDYECTDADLELDHIVLSDDIEATRMHQLAISLRPLATGGGGRSGMSTLNANRWEIRKAIMSLCSTPPKTLEVEATNKSASIRIAFSARTAAQDLSTKLRGVTVKIKGVKLHAFVREVSESSSLSEGADWSTSPMGSKVLKSSSPADREGGGEKRSREEAFNRLAPGKRPDTIVLRGVPANWLGGKGRAAAEGEEAPGLERIMRRLGPVRAVEVKPSDPHDDSSINDESGSAGGSTAGAPAVLAGRPGKGGMGKSGRAAPAADASGSGLGADFDVNALLENMPRPRALAKGKGGNRGRDLGATARAVGTSDGGEDVLSVGLHVDAWVQFASFRGFQRALKALQGKTLQKSGAEMLCEYRLGVDVSGYMTDEKRRERVMFRAEKAQEEERRKMSIQKARGQLVNLRDGVQSLRDAAKEDGRPALADAVGPIIQSVTAHVEKAETLLAARSTIFIDEPKATAAVAHARGEIAIARLSIRKARSTLDRAEEEERKRVEREKDEELREAARLTLRELEDNLSQALSLVSEAREHPGIKPQADVAVRLLKELSEACSKEGGGSVAFVAGGGGLVADARKAAETAVTRACMLQRYLGTCARLDALKGAVAEAVLSTDTDTAPAKGDGKVDNGGGGGSGVEGRGGRGEGSGVAGGAVSIVTSANHEGGGNVSADGVNVAGGILGTQLELVSEMLSRELEGLSEGDLLLLWERAEEALGVADELLETLKLVAAARRRLAEVKAMVASGDPGMKSSEKIMRFVAAAVMSTARAQREGGATVSPVSASASTSAAVALAAAAEKWRKAAILADSDATAAKNEVERVKQELSDKRQREEDERVRQKAEEERRLREEAAKKLERQARAAEMETMERRRAEARIYRMELRRKEMTAQVKNKEARRRLEEQFIARRSTASGGDGGPGATDGARRISKGAGHAATQPSIEDRWTMNEGQEDVPGDRNNNGASTLASGSAAVTGATPEASGAGGTAGSISGSGGSMSEKRAHAVGGADTRVSLSATGAGDTANFPLGEDRWDMNDGAADLAEHGVELEMGGAGLYMPPATLPGSLSLGSSSEGRGGTRRDPKRDRQQWAEDEEAEWLELVSKRMRSSIIVGGGAAGSWGVKPPNEDDEGETKRGERVVPGVSVGDDSGGGGDASYLQTGVGSGTKTTGGKVEAQLRQRLLAAKLGKAKVKAHGLELSNKVENRVIPSPAASPTPNTESH